MGDIYFTADTHYWHNNVLNFENRPYKSIEEMNCKMIDNWNDEISDSDIIYHLGDLSFGNYEQTAEIIKRLKGKIILIKGNHDYSKYYKKIKQLKLLHEYHEVGITLKYKKQQLWLTHYPLEIGLRPRKWSIHGHIHSNESTWDNQINVGVDSPHFDIKPFGKPISIDELFKALEDRLPFIEKKYLKMRGEHDIKNAEKDII